jgi:hypothetical protein
MFKFQGKNSSIQIPNSKTLNRLLEFGIFYLGFPEWNLGFFLSNNSLLLGSGTITYSKGQCIQPLPQQYPRSEWYCSVSTI